jgi:branched-chain amino acid transport system substrate-binding protein
MGVTVPILGGDGLDSSQLWEIAGKASEGTIVASHFHPDVPRPEVKHFIAAFQEKYGVLPDVWAAQGYDAVNLLASAMEKGTTTIPHKVAEVLRSAKDWPGVTGLYTFDENGDAVGKNVIKKIVRNGRFEYLDEGGQ